MTGLVVWGGLTFLVLRLFAGLVIVPKFFFQAEDGIRDDLVTGVQTCALPILVLHLLPAGRCNVLSGSWKQVQDYVWPGINSFAHLPYFEGWEFQTTDLKTPSGGLDRKSVV